MGICRKTAHEMWKVTWNELFFYNSMDCLYSEIMIFFQNVDYNYIFIF